MRRFTVWARCNHVGSDGDEIIIEMPDDATDEECRAACEDACDTLIGNNFDTGWDEIGAKPGGEG